MAQPASERYDDDPTRGPRPVDPPGPGQAAEPDDALRLAVAPAASALGVARDAVRAFLRRRAVPERAVCDVVLSMNEACKNAIRFSGSERSIDVTVAVEHDDVHVEVRDHGVGFAPAPIDTTVSPDVLRPSGRGLFLMACLMDDLRVARNRGAVIRMRKAVER
jgi:serine/threonine-protein kinase RsbW